MYGIGLRTKHYATWLEGEVPSGIDFVEVITENFATRHGRPRAVLAEVARRIPVVFHGVSLSLGGLDPLDLTYLDAIAQLAREIRPKWISDHLCFGTAHGHHAHDLWPVPRTIAMAKHVAARISEVQDRLGQRILVENISTYVQYELDELDELDFVVEVLERADCDLLLDVNNVVVNAYNHRFDPHAFIRALPASRIKQLHISGHAELPTHRFDDHQGPIPPSTWDVFDTTVATFGEVPTLVEWDRDVPELPVLVAEAEAARQRARSLLAPSLRVAHGA